MASLAKWFSVRLRTKWLWVRITLLSLKQVLTLETLSLNQVKFGEESLKGLGPEI